jgi:hypothetical protein
MTGPEAVSTSSSIYEVYHFVMDLSSIREKFDGG